MENSLIYILNKFPKFKVKIKAIQYELDGDLHLASYFYQKELALRQYQLK